MCHRHLQEAHSAEEERRQATSNLPGIGCDWILLSNLSSFLVWVYVGSSVAARCMCKSALPRLYSVIPCNHLVYPESGQNCIVLQQEAKAQTYFPVACDIYTQSKVARLKHDLYTAPNT